MVAQISELSPPLADGCHRRCVQLESRREVERSTTSPAPSHPRSRASAPSSLAGQTSMSHIRRSEGRSGCWSHSLWQRAERESLLQRLSRVSPGFPTREPCGEEVVRRAPRASAKSPPGRSVAPREERRRGGHTDRGRHPTFASWSLAEVSTAVMSSAAPCVIHAVHTRRDARSRAGISLLTSLRIPLAEPKQATVPMTASLPRRATRSERRWSHP